MPLMGLVCMKTVDSLVPGTSVCTPVLATGKYVGTTLDIKLKVTE